MTAGHGLTLTVEAKPPHVTPVERRTFEVWFGDSLAVHFAIGIAQDRYDWHLRAVRYSTAKVICLTDTGAASVMYAVVAEHTTAKPSARVELAASVCIRWYLPVRGIKRFWG